MHLLGADTPPLDGNHFNRIHDGKYNCNDVAARHQRAQLYLYRVSVLGKQ